jgi:hypothetical protein
MCLAACSGAESSERGGSQSQGAGAGGAPSGGSGSGADSGASTSTFAGPGGHASTGSGSETEVNVIITTDNAYGFGYGTANAMLNYFGGVENVEATQIFDCPIGNGPEEYVVPPENANVGGFLYVVTYADKNYTQGVLGKFFRQGGEPIFTGNGSWEACATGQDFDLGSGGPTLQDINDQIDICNAGTGDPATTSQGWVTTRHSQRGFVVFGEDNSTPTTGLEPGNEFPIVCEIDSEARWMWYEWDPNRTSGSPFIWPGGVENTTKDFLIFRLGAEFVPTPK